MKNIKNLRIYIIFGILLNLSLYVSLSNFLVLEKGIHNVLNGTYSDPLIEMQHLSKEGKGKVFYVEDYNSASGDGTQYMKMALGEESYPPYSLRPFFPRLVGYTALGVASIIDGENTKATQLNLLQPIMSFYNSIFLAITTIFLFLAIRKYLDDELISGLLALGLIVNVGTIQTSQFFMLDVTSYVIGAMAIYFFAHKKYWLLSITIALGILIKEVIIIYSILLLYPFLKDKEQFFFSAKLLIAPILFFVGLRLLMNVDPLSMQYDWDISKGEIKLHYLSSHLGGLKEIMIFGVKIFFTFGILWLFAFISIWSKEKKMIIVLFLSILAIILANALLASRVPRVIFVMYPAIAILSAIGISILLKKK